MKREDYISWDEYFMGVAILAAKRSKDPNTQVGACIVNKSKRILSTGYNGFPYGCSDDTFSWDREGEDLFPCNECAKAIIQSGISEIVYLYDKYADTPETIASKKMLTAAGIRTTQLNLHRDTITIDFNRNK